jgi:hypothetical protein
MRHGLVSNLTTAALAAHILLGCCWHHAHAGARQSASGEISCDAAESLDAILLLEQHARGQDLRNSTCHDNGNCFCIRCVFAHSKHGSTTLGSIAPCRDIANWDSAMAILSMADLTPRWDAFLTVGRGNPLRLHLMHQVLLL